jgi:hypothetical protein
MPLRRRIFFLVLSICAGIGAGIAGDFLDSGIFAAPENEFSVLGVALSLLVSVLVIPLGAGGVSIRPLVPYLAIAGLMFYPVLVSLAFLWLHGGRRYWLCVAIFLWCAQGFFQFFHRAVGLPTV